MPYALFPTKVADPLTRLHSPVPTGGRIGEQGNGILAGNLVHPGIGRCRHVIDDKYLIGRATGSLVMVHLKVLVPRLRFLRKHCMHMLSEISAEPPMMYHCPVPIKGSFPAGMFHCCRGADQCRHWQPSGELLVMVTSSDKTSYS